MENSLPPKRITKKQFDKLVKDSADNWLKELKIKSDKETYIKLPLEDSEDVISVDEIGNSTDTTQDFFLMSLSKNRKDFNEYKWIEDRFKNVDQFNHFIEAYAQHKGLLIARDEMNILHWDYAKAVSEDEYAINTRTIFWKLTSRWQDFDRAFLSDEVQTALSISLRQEPPMPMRTHRIDQYQKLLNQAKDGKNFPFPEFEISHLHHSDENIVFVFSFKEMQHIVNNEDLYFDLLFAIQFYLTDVMKADDFLQYHLDNNFDGDIISYSRFLKLLTYSYKSFLKPDHDEIIQGFIKAQEIENPSKDKTISKMQRIIALKLMLDAIINDKDKINEVAEGRLIDIIIDGRKREQEKNSYAYRIINAFRNKSKENKKTDLDSIRSFFTDARLNFKPVLDEVDLMLSIEKTRPEKKKSK